MADFPTITDTISYRFENQFVRSVSDKLDGFLHRAHEFEFSNPWLVASSGDQKRLRQARQEDSEQSWKESAGHFRDLNIDFRKSTLEGSMHIAPADTYWKMLR
jgi:hypothetical protein